MPSQQLCYEGLERTSPLCKIKTSIFPTMQDFDVSPVCRKRNKNLTKFSSFPTMKVFERTFPLRKITTSIFPTMQDFDASPVCRKRNKNPIKFSFFPTMKVQKGIPHYVRLQPASSPLSKILMLSQYVGKAAKILSNFHCSPQ